MFACDFTVSGAVQFPIETNPEKIFEVRKSIFYIYFMIQSGLLKQTDLVRMKDKKKGWIWCVWLKMFSYLASRNFLSLLGRPWFLRCLNHLWTCRTELPVCLLKLSTELWQHKQEKDGGVRTVIKWLWCEDMWYFYNSHPFTPQTPFLNSMIRACVVLLPKDTQYVWGSASFLKYAGSLPVWDALMCCRNRPPGRDLEEHKHVSCHVRPAVRQEELLPSWKEKNTLGGKHCLHVTSYLPERKTPIS